MILVAQRDKRFDDVKGKPVPSGRGWNVRIGEVLISTTHSPPEGAPWADEATTVMAMADDIDPDAVLRVPFVGWCFRSPAVFVGAHPRSRLGKLVVRARVAGQRRRVKRWSSSPTVVGGEAPCATPRSAGHPAGRGRPE